MTTTASQNPHDRRLPGSPGPKRGSIPVVGNLWRNRQLILQMARRDVVGRYKGSALGLLWSFLTPLLMLSVYTFVFSVIFKARWGVGGDESRTTFAIVLFVGMIVHGVFAEVINRSPDLVLQNTNFVKKVVFPLEILPVVILGSALFHAFVSTLVLCACFLVVNGHLPWTVLFLPVIILPLAVLTLGIAWFMASLGVFVRDLGQLAGIVTTIMLFLAPVFYPTRLVPAALAPFVLANPLTFIIVQAREVAIWGHLPDWAGLSVYLFISVAVALGGFAWFQKTRRGFADVL